MDKGRLEEFVLICPCHGRRFDVRTGECLNDSLKLRRYESKSKSGRFRESLLILKPIPGFELPAYSFSIIY